MIFKYYFTYIRRRRYYLFNTIFIIVCCGLFFHIRHSSSNSPSETLHETAPVSENILLNKILLNCSDDLLKQWCKNQVHLCNSSLVVYNQLFVVTRSVILQPILAYGKRLGGEDIKDVMNQTEQIEYFQFDKNFIRVISSIIYPKTQRQCNRFLFCSFLVMFKCVMEYYPMVI